MARITRNINNWDVYNGQVERDTDNAPYSAAHPDDVLFLAGPARRASVVPSATSGVGSLMSLGLIQMANIASSLPVQPSKGLGSSRKFFLIDSAQNQVSVARLVMNQRNLLRALYHSAVEAGIDVGNRQIIGYEASYAGRDKQQWWVNLDSPIFRLPIGLAIVLRDRGGSHIGGFYCELAHVTQWSLSIASGQAAIMENVSIICDSILPFGDSSVVGALAALFDTALGDPQLTANAKADAGASDKLT